MPIETQIKEWIRGMGYQDIFKRYELKYLVTREQKALLLQAMEPYMQPDEHGQSLICNIYFDTPDYLLVQRSLESPVYKEKLRLRSYGMATHDGETFLELKKKYKGVVYKRRVSLREQEAMDYLLKDKPLRKSNQITDEIDYFREMYQGLAPRVFLSYEREAFYGREDRELRITFDENILWRQEALSLCAGAYGSPLLQLDTALMEVKIASAMPLWLCKLLADNDIFKTHFSKYGNAYCQMQTMEEEKDLGGRKYA
ncbi:MAG: polyphosphate polymerase domain-containing protein [Muribaculum sp.]|nr:polyphosphate polymerase domain-containing protein [Muribaculum sp.]